MKLPLLLLLDLKSGKPAELKTKEFSALFKARELWSTKAAFTIAFFAALNHNYDHKHEPWNRGSISAVSRVRSDLLNSLRKQQIYGDATTGFSAKWRLTKELRDSILMTRHYPDLGSASDWSWRVGNLIQPIRSTTPIWNPGISALVSQTSLNPLK